MATKIYKEKQRFSNRLIYVSILALFGLSLARMVHEMMQNGFQNTYIILTCALICIGLAVLFWYYYNLRLKVAISDHHISFKMKPLHLTKQRIAWDDIKTVEVIKTPEIDQWQGGNITFNHETRFSVNGRNGLHIITKAGKEFFIGFRDITALKAAIDTVFPKK